MTSFSRSQQARVPTPVLEKNRRDVPSASTRVTPKAALVQPPQTAREDAARVKIAYDGYRKPRARHVFNDPAEVANRHSPAIYEFDPQTHVPEYPGQREGVSARGYTVVDAPITVEAVRQVAWLDPEVANRYLAPKSHRRRDIPVAQLADHSDKPPSPIDQDGNRQKRI